MGKLSKCQGEPMHIETIKSDGKRRHPARCKHVNKCGNRIYICMCTENIGYYNKKCPSSKNCEYYEE